MTPGAKSQPAEDVVWLSWNKQGRLFLISGIISLFLNLSVNCTIKHNDELNISLHTFSEFGLGTHD